MRLLKHHVARVAFTSIDAQNRKQLRSERINLDYANARISFTWKSKIQTYTIDRVLFN